MASANNQGWKKALFIFLAACLVWPLGMAAVEDSADIVETTAADIGVDLAAANDADSEAVSETEQTGTLIEIGNTTTEETTVIIRVAEDGQTIDETVQVAADTAVLNDADAASDLSDWIAGDQIAVRTRRGENSGELKALRLRNRSMKKNLLGKNGWVKDRRPEKNEMDVEWAGKIYTLNTANAKMVAGAKNPAALTDFQIGDRVRARVSDDQDSDTQTWNANIIVVLRRGQTLFMRVTRWVVPAEITALPEDLSVRPAIITAKVLPSKFFEKGDVNNLIGEPGTEIKIQIEEKTKIVRRFLGRALLTEFMEGDRLLVIGRLNEGTGNLDARIVKNDSLQALGVAQTVSEVVSVNPDNNTVVIKPISRKNPATGKRVRLSAANQWTITLRANAPVSEQGEKITLAAVQTGDIIRFRGVINRTQKTGQATALAVVTDKFSSLLEQE